jgi:hypothetical protein
MDSQRTTGSSDSLPIRRLDASNAARYRNNSGVRDSMFTAVRDSARWVEMWRRLTARHSPARPAPPIDFEQEIALVATLGEQRTGGYAITIEAAIDHGGYVEAHVRRRVPGRGCGVAGMLTTPADVVLIPRREVGRR